MLVKIANWLVSLNINKSFAEIFAYLILILFVILLSLIINWVTKKVLLKQVSRLIRFSKSSWDDVFLEQGVFNHIAQLAPVVLIYFCAPLFGKLEIWIYRISEGVIILIVLLILNDLIESVNTIYETQEIAKERPIKGYLQVMKIIIFLFGGILTISAVIDKSPWVLLGGLSAMTAVLLLVFQDTILGFVASIQFAMNNMVRIGDWIEMPQYNADGDVLEVTVTTVKVQNWDKTITTIPTYALVSNSFKNWRGMEESDGRRIKRAINIDMNSIKFCDEALLERFKKINHLKDYLSKKESAIEEYNRKRNFSEDDRINARILTNIGTFRAYVVNYLRKHPDINQEMTLLVRQLKPGETGLPIELYAFSRKKVWEDYEDLQSDIFDHLLAILPEFELKVFQSPAGQDIQKLKMDEIQER